MLPRESEKLHGEKRGEAANPGVGRLRNDDIVSVGRSQEEVSPICDDRMNPRVLEDFPVFLGKEPRRVHHRRLDLNDIDPLDGVAGDGAGGDTAPKTNHESRSRIPVHE